MSGEDLEAGIEPEGERPRRRRSPLAAISTPVAILALAAVAWLLWDMWPEVAYFASPLEPIDLGRPGAYHIDRAVPNRLVRIDGAPVASVGGVEARGGQERRVVGLFGLSLAVDRPGGAAPTTLHEGRLLPARRSQEYAPFVAELRRRGWAAGERWMVLRDGERPRSRWGRPLLSLLLAALGAINLRALIRNLAG